MKSLMPLVLKNMSFDSIAIHIVFTLSNYEDPIPFDIKFVILALLLDAIHATSDDDELLKVQHLAFSPDALVWVERTHV
jgi:hypothetical protein